MAGTRGEERRETECWEDPDDETYMIHEIPVNP